MKKSHEQIIRNENGEEYCKVYFIKGQIVIQSKGKIKMSLAKTKQQVHINKTK